MKVLFLLASALPIVLTGCSPSEQQQISNEWACGSNIQLTFRLNGTYKIVSTATNPIGTWEGKYSVANKKILIAEQPVYPLDIYTEIAEIKPLRLALRNEKLEILDCSAKR